MKASRILIIGATSAVAQGVAKRFAQQHNARIYCLARSTEKMEALAEELGEAYAGSIRYDFNQTLHARQAVKFAVEALGEIDIALIAHGALYDQMTSEQDFATAQATFETNLLSVVAFLIPLSEQMLQQGFGKIGVITSVAGDRGRPRNYTYGAAKGALHIYLQGLRSRLWRSGVEIYTFKMGPVDTPMTVDHEKNFSFTTVDEVSVKIVKAFGRKRYECYIPGFWRLVMLGVRVMPEWVFQRLNFLAGR